MKLALFSCRRQSVLEEMGMGIHPRESPQDGFYRVEQNPALLQDGSECGGSFKYNRNLLQNILRLLSCTFPLRNMVCKKKYMRHASAAVPCKCRGSCSSFSDDPALPLPVLRSVRVHFRGLRTLPAGSMFCRTEKKSIADIFGKQPDTVDQQKQGKPPQQFAAPDEKQGKSGNPAADRN